ncbi:helix-turn-helix transcriptional regulator [Actinacidiphila soli]|uniref:helix-turn-helix transcriptional regulator n=1 Tax=Actinacidiphila soli TaxID=2487275 RepID=UPI0019D0038F|nr:WYL domain-containing protein [Actinacidiphila soli]
MPYPAAVASAVWDRRAIRVRYRRWAAPQEVTRVLDPYGLVLKGGRWYLVTAAAGPVRTYRLSQILRIEAGEECSFGRSAGFDLAAYWASYLTGFDTRRHRLTVTVRISPRGPSGLPDVLEQAAVRAVERAAEPPDAEGRTRADIPVESVEHAEQELLRLGVEVEMLAPQELRTAMARTAEAIARRHRR